MGSLYSRSSFIGRGSDPGAFEGSGEMDRGTGEGVDCRSRVPWKQLREPGLAFVEKQLSEPFAKFDKRLTENGVENTGKQKTRSASYRNHACLHSLINAIVHEKEDT